MGGKSFSTFKVLLNREVIFSLIILAFGLYVVIATFGYEMNTGLFAGLSAGILVIMTVAVLIREIHRALVKVEFIKDTSAKAHDQYRESLPVVLGWCVGLLGGVLLIGFQRAIPIWVIVFLLSHRASIVLTIVLPIVLWAVVRFALMEGLETVLFKGILFGGVLPRFW